MLALPRPTKSQRVGTTARELEPCPRLCSKPAASGRDPLWKPPQQDGHVIAAKGAPEAIAGLCGLDGDALKEILHNVDQMATRGLRVLGVAKASSPGPPWPDSPSAFRFDFLGLVGLADPLRPGVREAVNECRSAGIRVVMVTGDYLVTAEAITRQAGLDPAGGVITGNGLAQMSDLELRECVVA